MRFPVVHGTIDRRILVNYRVDPKVAARFLPAPFKPMTVHGVAMVGICLIRLKSIRPTHVPSVFGISSENAAHRTAVEWDDNGVLRRGVYIRRRDSSSWLNTLAGGRLFPGYHHHAAFSSLESSSRLDVRLRSDDGETDLSVSGRVASDLPSTSVFRSLHEASAFFEAGSVGYSATPDPSRFQGLELRSHTWQLEPLNVEEVRSSFFEEAGRFPAGSIQFDCALLMRNISHEWHSMADLCCSQPQRPTLIPQQVA